MPKPLNLNFLLLLLLAACAPSEVYTPEELAAYVADEANGLTRKEEAGGVTLTATYRPTALLVAQELEAYDDADTTLLETLKQKYTPYTYFLLEVTDNGHDPLTTGRANAGELLQTLAFRMEGHINLTTSASDTIPLADYVFPRMYGLTHNASLLLVFSAEEIKNADWLSLNVQEFGLGTGTRRFRFQTKDIKNIPDLIYTDQP